jgi:hypothetical protein
VDGAVGFDVGGKLFPRLDGVDDEAAAGKLAAGLQEQVDAVHDEVELGHHAQGLEPVGEKADVVVGEGGLAAALRVPDDTLFDTPASSARSIAWVAKSCGYRMMCFS